MEMKPMNKYEFLSQLRSALSALSTEEREAAMSYYEEFYSDAGQLGHSRVIGPFDNQRERKGRSRIGGGRHERRSKQGRLQRLYTSADARSNRP